MQKIEMRNCLVTMVLACFLAVHGCASPSPSAPGSDPGAAEGGQSASSEEAPANTEGATQPTATPSSTTDGGGGESVGLSEATQTTSAVADTASVEKPAEPPTEASSGAAQTEEASPVHSSATEKETTSTLSNSQAALLAPTLAGDTAPDIFEVKFTTTKGDFVIEVHRDWAPNGADRLYNLVKIGFFTDVAFFRVMKNFVVQFGIHGDPGVSAAWLEATIEDDKVIESNTRGLVSFADRRSANTRTTQLFINLAGMNSYLDEEGYAPVGKMIEGMDVVGALHDGYGDGAPRGSGPNQAAIQSQGNEYLRRDFPDLDYVKSASIVK